PLSSGWRCWYFRVPVCTGRLQVFQYGVPHSIPFSFEILLIIGVGLYFYRYIFYDFQTVTYEPCTFCRIIRHQSHLGHPNRTKYLGTYTIITQIGFKSQLNISIDGVHSSFLQLISVQLVDKTNTSTLLIHVHDHAFTLFLNHLHGTVQLRSTIASARAKNISSHTRTVHPNEYRLVFFPLAFIEGDMLLTCRFLCECFHMKIPICCGHMNGHLFFDQGVVLQAVFNQILDTNDFHIESLGDFHQIRQSSHLAIILEDFDQYPCRLKTCQPREIHSSLCMSCSAKYAAIHRDQWKNMPWATKLFRFDIRINQRFNRFGTIRCRNTRCTAIALQIDRHGKVGLIYRRNIPHHRFQLQLYATLHSQWRTYQSPAECGHEIDNFWCCIASGRDEITLILSVFVIYYNNDFPRFDLFNRFFDCI